MHNYKSIFLFFKHVKVLFIVCFCFYSIHSSSQVLQTNIYESFDHPHTTTYRVFEDSLQTKKAIQNLRNKLLSDGYVFANIDTTIRTNDTVSVYIYQGKKFKISLINLDPAQQSILEESGIKSNRAIELEPDSIRVHSFLQTLLNHQISNGFPFASVSFDSTTISENGIQTKIKVDKGPLISFGDILVEGRIRLPSRFFNRLLDFKPGQPYNHTTILDANKRILDLPYAIHRNPPIVRFINQKANLVLTVDPKPASRFDFLIGMLRQVNSVGSQWIITGDFTAELNNMLNFGEYSFFQFKRLRPENLELIIKSTIPYIAKSPIGTHFDFRLFKNGNLNLDVFFNGGVQYQFGGYNQIKLYGSVRNSSIVEANKEQIIQSKKLPDVLDASYQGVGLGLNLRQLDYRFNPTKGYDLVLNFGAGGRKIKANRQILEIPGFEQSYDSLSSKSFQVELDLQASYYFPVQKWAAIKAGAFGSMRYNAQPLNFNELLRIGGNKTLRGYDEESIFTSKFLIGTAEFRILLDPNSYFTLPFVDFGISHTFREGIFLYEKVLGTGIALNFGTKAGVFNLAFAAGKTAQSTLDFSRMKIHFGYINLF